MIEYPQYKKLSDDYIIGKITCFLKEDIPNGDITTESTASDNSEITAEIYVAEKLIFAGSEIIPHCFGEKCQVTINHKNGSVLSHGDVIGLVTGSA